MHKYYISADQLLHDSIQLALAVAESDWRPDLIVGIWRGGAPVGVTVQEVLAYIGIDSDHLAIRTKSYTGIATRSRVEVYGLDELLCRMKPTSKVLLVDDVHDSGLSLRQVTIELGKLCSPMPEVRTAVPYYKPGNDRSRRVPDYYVHATDDWLVFPHELDGLTDEEIQQHKPGLGTLVPRLFALRERLRKRDAS